LPTVELESRPTEERPGWRKWLARLGPGIITGASDDDPSGIATYSQAGARFGLSLLWTLLFTLPLMAAVQEISARLGRVTGRGVAANIRRHYPAWVLYPIIFLVVAANTINLGADIGAMGDAVSLLVGGPKLLYSALFALACVLLQMFLSYRHYADYLKWLTLVLFAYVATAFLTQVHWKDAAYATFVPKISLNGSYIATFIGVLGTTISRYLFVWQAALETVELRSKPQDEPLKKDTSQARPQFERIRWDTYIGMTFSNLVAYCIVLTAAAALYAHGIRNVDSSRQAAEALRPIAGKGTYILFAAGIIGTGLLAVPVLAGSAAYAVGEALKWPTGLDRKPLDAKGFYGVMIVATVIGLAINFSGRIDPIQALFWAAVINGLVAVPVMVIMMHMAGSKTIMGPFSRVSKGLRVTGWIATLVMVAAAIGLFATWGK
jgi:NRAMP (natural resistance-associated macrophage protein)-like metal ion transporter